MLSKPAREIQQLPPRPPGWVGLDWMLLQSDIHACRTWTFWSLATLQTSFDAPPLGISLVDQCRHQRGSGIHRDVVGKIGQHCCALCDQTAATCNSAHIPVFQSFPLLAIAVQPMFDVLDIGARHGGMLSNESGPSPIHTGVGLGRTGVAARHPLKPRPGHRLELDALGIELPTAPNGVCSPQFLADKHPCLW